jgi:hypothetical protein
MVPRLFVKTINVGGLPMQSDEGKTKMVAGNGYTKMAEVVAYPDQPIPDSKKAVATGKVRIQTIRAVADGDQHYAEGTVLDVHPDFAKEFCDRKFYGQASHFGERLEGNSPKHEIVRAIRLS